MADRYQVLIAWSPQDGEFVAHVLDLPGCSAHGSSEVEALAHATAAIDLYLNDLRECGEPLPEPRRYQLLSA